MMKGFWRYFFSQKIDIIEHRSEKITEYQDARAKTSVLVVPTNEEWQAAKEYYGLLNG